jgi:hypothetical protein
LATIGQSDLSFIGVLKAPAEVIVAGVPRSTSWGSVPLGLRKVAGETRFFSTAWFGGIVYEMNHPGYGADLASAPVATVVNVWDDGTGSFYGPYVPPAPGNSGGNQIRSLVWFDGDAHLNPGLFWSFGVKYGGDQDWPSLGFTEISGSVATPRYNWKIAGYGSGYRRTGALPMPDGRIALAGGGGFSGIGAGFSFGPALFAMTTADMAAATPTTNLTSPANGSNVPYQTLLVYSISAINAPPYVTPTPALRDNDYRPAIFGTITRNAASATQVYVPLANFSDFTTNGIGRNLKIRGETKLIASWSTDGIDGQYTVATPFSFIPQVGDGVEIPLDNDPAASSIALWMPQGATGYMTGNEHVGQPVWIEGGDKRAVIFPQGLVKGRIHYQGGGIHLEARKHIASAYDPDDLDGSANIDPLNTIDFAALGLPDPDTFSPFFGEVGRDVNFAWDPDESILYAILNYAWQSGGEWHPAIYAYSVNLISSAGGTRPEMTEPITRLMPGGYGGKRYGPFTRSGPVILLTVTDLANGGGFLATVSGCDSASVNTLYSTRWSGTVGGSAWTVAGVRTGPGDIGGALTVGYRWWYVRSVSGSSAAVSSLVYQPLTDGAAALHDRILEAVTAKIQSLAIVGLAGVYLHKFPSVAKSDGPGLVVTYFGEAEEMMGGDRAADEIGFPVLIYQDAPTLVEEETRPRELLWRAQVNEALNGQRLAGVPEVTTCIVEPRSVLEQGSEMLTRNPQDVANRMRSGMLFRFVARVARGA